MNTYALWRPAWHKLSCKFKSNSAQKGEHPTMCISYVPAVAMWFKKYYYPEKIPTRTTIRNRQSAIINESSLPLRHGKIFERPFY